MKNEKMPHINDRLEKAIQTYVDSLSFKDLIKLVSDDLLDYYQDGADEEEQQMFIEEMESK